MLKSKKITYKKSELQNQRILDTPELIAYTGLSHSTINKLNASRILPNGKPHGKKIYYDREKIDEWLLSNGSHGSQKRNSDAATFINNPKKKK